MITVIGFVLIVVSIGFMLPPVVDDGSIIW